MPNGEENLHANHRQRLRKRFSQDGLLSFEDHNILELLLFYAIPRCDTNPIAHRLLLKFKSLHGVFSATKDELVQVKGMGQSSAEFINLCGWIAREDALSELQSLPFNRDERIGAYFTWFFRQIPWESSCILMLDGNMGFISCEIINLGNKYKPASVQSKALELAVSARPAYVFLAHSHPDGKMRPSPDDSIITSSISSALKKEGIILLGHYIVHDFDYTDFMKQSDQADREMKKTETEIEYGI